MTDPDELLELAKADHERLIKKTEKAVAALASYEQADQDGIMVLVSRQAIHEVLDGLEGRDAKLHRLISENASLLTHLRLAEERADSAWQPIETAPKSTPVLLYGKDCIAPNICVAVLNVWENGTEDWFDLWSQSIVDVDMTHWMPLPPRPTPPAKDQSHE